MSAGARRRYSAVGVLLAALIALAVALSACGSSGESTDRSFHEAFQEWNASKTVSDVMKEEAIRGSQEEEFVKTALAGHAVASVTVGRWYASDGKSLTGAIVHLHLKEPLNMRAVEVPAWVTAGPKATNNPPIPLRRRVLYTGTGIEELEVLMTEPRREVLEIIPRGGSIEPPQLMSPVDAGYEKVGEHPGIG